MNILLVEEDLHFAQQLEIQLKELGVDNTNAVTKFSEARVFLNSNKVDIVLFNITPENNAEGFKLATKLRARQTPIIFITGAGDEKIYQAAMPIKPFGFLVKPFDKITLRSCIDRAIKLVQGRNATVEGSPLEESFFVKQNELLRKINLEDILWIEADGNYINIHLKDKKFVTKLSLTKMEKKIKVPYLKRAHKKFLVNLKKVDDIHRNAKLLISDTTIPIGPKFRTDLLRTIREEDF